MISSDQFDKVPVDDTIDFLKDTCNVNIVVDWRALHAAYVDPQNVDWQKLKQSDAQSASIKLRSGNASYSTVSDMAIELGEGAAWLSH